MVVHDNQFLFVDFSDDEDEDEKPVVVHDDTFLFVDLGDDSEECVKKCECNEGFVLNDSGECIEAQFCPG